MKHSKLFLAALAVCAVSFAGFSQKVKLVSGDLSFLKGQTNLDLAYDFSDFSVGKFDNEADYKTKKIKEYNDKESGRGDKWSQSWENDKVTRFPNKFEELITKGMEGVTVKQNNADATYRLIVKTTFIEPGYNVGVSSKPAGVSFEYTFVDKADPSKVLAKLTQEEVPGSQAMGMDYDTGTRISESYAKGAKMLAAFIAKNMK